MYHNGSTRRPRKHQQLGCPNCQRRSAVRVQLFLRLGMAWDDLALRTISPPLSIHFHLVTNARSRQKSWDYACAVQRTP